ncbi:unnamed protein product, partial [marine sediment metagenome]
MSKSDGPTQGILGEEYTFISKTVDPEYDPISYIFDWGDGKKSEWLGPNESGVVVSATHKWKEEGNYSITVKAKDSFGYESDWSEPENIDINILEFSMIRGGIGIHAEIKNIGSRQLWRLEWVISYVGGRIQNPANDEFEGELLNLGAGESVKIATGPFFEIGRIKITISLT